MIFSFIYDVVLRALRCCEDMIQRYSRTVNNSPAPSSGETSPRGSCSNVGKAVEDCMRAIIGVLLNLTHDNGILTSLAYPFMNV